MGVGPAPRPDRFTLGKEPRYTLQRRLGVQKGRCGRVCRGDLLPLSGFKPRAVDPVVIPYTAYPIRPQLCLVSRLRMSGHNLFSPSMRLWHGQGKLYLLLCCVLIRARSSNVRHEVRYPDCDLSLVSSQLHINFRAIPAVKTACFSVIKVPRL